MFMDSLNNNAPHGLASGAGFHHYVDTTGASLPVSAFSAFHLLRNYNYLIGPPHPEISKSTSLSELHGRLQAERALHSPSKPPPPPPPPPPRDCEKPLTLDVGKTFPPLSHHPPPNLLAAHSLFNNMHYHGVHHGNHSNALLSPESYLSLKRHRGEKKPIPEEQKDEKYFERRKRNNQAAKKSRDARKIREDQVALRATILEHENAILKAQVITLREEASSLRQMLLQKKTIELGS